MLYSTVAQVTQVYTALPHSIIAQATPQTTFKTETEFLQYAIPVLLTALGVLFYLLRDSYNTRITDKEALVKIHAELLAQVTALQIKSFENQVKNVDVLEGLKKALDASNDANQKLITALNEDRITNLKQQVKDLKKPNKKAVNDDGVVEQKES